MRRWLFEGNMEAPPGWMVEEWNLLQCAKWVGVAPWVLAEQPAFWLNKIQFYAGIEGEVQEMRVKNATQKSTGKSRR